MYWRDNGKIVRASAHKAVDDATHAVQRVMHEGYRPQQAMMLGGKFPIWALIVIVVALFVIGISLIWWLWASKH
jgi:hypothetical protein